VRFLRDYEVFRLLLEVDLEILYCNLHQEALQRYKLELAKFNAGKRTSAPSLPTTRVGLTTKVCKELRSVGRTLMDPKILIFGVGRGDLRNLFIAAYATLTQNYKISALVKVGCQHDMFLAMQSAIAGIAQLAGALRMLSTMMFNRRVCPSRWSLGVQSLRMHVMTFAVHYCWRYIPNVVKLLPGLLVHSQQGYSFQNLPIKLGLSRFAEPPPRKRQTLEERQAEFRTAQNLDHPSEIWRRTIEALDELARWLRLELLEVRGRLVTWDIYPGDNREVNVGMPEASDNAEAEEAGVEEESEEEAEEIGVEPRKRAAELSAGPAKYHFTPLRQFEEGGVSDLQGSMRRELVKQAQAGKFEQQEAGADNSLGDGADSSTDSSTDEEGGAEEETEEEAEKEAEGIGVESRRLGQIPHYGQPFFGRGFVPRTPRFDCGSPDEAARQTVLLPLCLNGESCGNRLLEHSIQMFLFALGRMSPAMHRSVKWCPCGVCSTILHRFCLAFVRVTQRCTRSHRLRCLYYRHGMNFVTSIFDYGDHLYRSCCGARQAASVGKFVPPS
jgi:hypothetical protein